jgi:DNA repair exonuclease SbcCD ATPase subunit
MKTTIYFYRLPFALAVVLGATVLGGCDGPTTKSDVQDDLKDAQEATQEAQEETQEARAAQEQFYADTHKTQVKELEDRSNKIGQQIAKLKQVSEKSSNQAAQVDIASAVQELQDEKETLNEKIVKVKSIKEEDWSASYDEISAAIGKIEGEIDNLSQSLETNN